MRSFDNLWSTQLNTQFITRNVRECVLRSVHLFIIFQRTHFFQKKNLRVDDQTGVGFDELKVGS